MHELALFAGAGGGILAGRELGWRTVCAVEIDAYARAVLMARQDDGSLEPFPIWDDVRTFDGSAWAGLVDVVSGGFPCQDISIAGRGAGIDGARSGLWREMARIIGEVRPRFVLVENSPTLVTRGLGTVLGDLAALGYDAEWGVLGASDVGAPHRRQRIWIVGWLPDPDRQGQLQQGWPLGAERKRASDMGCDVPDAERGGAPVTGLDGEAQGMADPDCAGRIEQRRTVADGAQHPAAQRGGWWAVEPDVGRVAHGVASRVDRLRCLGNGQVPQCAAEAWRQLMARAQSPW